MNFEYNQTKNVREGPFFHMREREYRARYRANCLGSFRLICSGQRIEEAAWKRSKTKALLKWFLLNHNKMFSADQLLDMFWPTLPAEVAKNNLHVSIYYLRHIFEPDLSARQESHYIRRVNNNFYWLECDDSWWMDTCHLVSLSETARTFEQHGEYSKARSYYQRLIAIYGDGLLPEDSHEPWLQVYRHHYEQLYSQALMRLIELSQQQRNYDDTLEYAYLALLSDPMCEYALRAIIDIFIEHREFDRAVFMLNDLQRSITDSSKLLAHSYLDQLREKVRNAYSVD